MKKRLLICLPAISLFILESVLYVIHGTPWYSNVFIGWRKTTWDEWLVSGLDLLCIIAGFLYFNGWRYWIRKSDPRDGIIIGYINGSCLVAEKGYKITEYRFYFLFFYFFMFKEEKVCEGLDEISAA